MRRQILQVLAYLSTTITINLSRVEYGISALGDYIKGVLGSVVRSKPTDTEQLEVSEGMILQAIKSPISNNKNGTSLYSPSLELMQDDSIVMYSDSELSSNEESSFYDASAEDDLAEFLQEANNKDDSNDEDDDEDIIDDFNSLNDLIKVRCHVSSQKILLKRF